jgi:hypothetical protein
MAISAVVAAVSTAGLAFTTGFATVSAAATYFLVTTAMGAALNALTPKPNFGASGGYSLQGVSGAALDHQIIYGETRVGGVRVYDVATGNKNKNLNRIIAFAGHEIDSYQEIYLNDEVITLSGASVTVPERYDGKVTIAQYLGTTTQTADTGLITETAGLPLNEGRWTSAHRLQGIAYLYTKFVYNASAFPNGLPAVSAVIRGKKVYDPRDTNQDVDDETTWVWSNNPALCLRDYLTSEYGLNQPADRIDDSLVIAAANICDQTVEGEKRYTCNGAFTTNDEPATVATNIVSSMGGLLWYGQGKWRMKAAAWTAPTVSFTEDDLRSSISLSTRHSRRDNFNSVKGTFRGPLSDWQPADYPEVTDPAFLEADNNLANVLDFPLAFTSSDLTAQRIARIALNRNREQLTFSASFGMRAFQVQVGDFININNERFGFVNKPFEVTEWNFGLTEGLDIQVRMTLREISEGVFTGAVGSTFEQNNTTLPNPFDVPAVTFDGDPVTETVIRADGGVVSNAIIEWNVSDDAFVDRYVLRWRKTGSTDVQSVFVLGTYYSIPDVETGVSYTIEIAARNLLGITSPFTERVVTFTADVTAPSAPTPTSATGGFQQITVRWTNPSQKDLKEVEVYANTSNTTSGASLVGKISGDTFVHSVPVQNTTRYYFFKAVDFTGNTSGFSTGVSGTTLADPQDGTDGADGTNGTNGTNGTDGTDGDTGDTIVTGRVYYQILQASSPSTPSASSYNVATGTFSGLTANWALTQPSVDITDTSVQEWSSQFQVTIDGVTSAQTISFTSPSGAIQVTADIESDNYVAGVSGWKIERDTGNAEFQDAIIRGTLNAADITAGTLNADRINIDGVSLDTSGGQLIIKDLGVTTGKINTSAVTTPIIASRAATDVSVFSVFSTTLTGIGSVSLGSFSVSELTMILIQSAANCYGTGTGTTYSLALQLDGSATDLYLNSSNDSYATFDDLRFPVQILVNRFVSAGSHTLGLSYVVPSGNSLELVSLDVVVTVLKR